MGVLARPQSHGMSSQAMAGPGWVAAYNRAPAFLSSFRSPRFAMLRRLLVVLTAAYASSYIPCAVAAPTAATYDLSRLREPFAPSTRDLVGLRGSLALLVRIEPSSGPIPPA